jgi:hypothetical protein
MLFLSLLSLLVAGRGLRTFLKNRTVFKYGSEWKRFEAHVIPRFSFLYWYVGQEEAHVAVALTFTKMQSQTVSHFVPRFVYSSSQRINKMTVPYSWSALLHGASRRQPAQEKRSFHALQTRQLDHVAHPYEHAENEELTFSPHSPPVLAERYVSTVVNANLTTRSSRSEMNVNVAQASFLGKTNQRQRKVSSSST